MFVLSGSKYIWNTCRTEVFVFLGQSLEPVKWKAVVFIPAASCPALSLTLSLLFLHVLLRIWQCAEGFCLNCCIRVFATEVTIL